MKAQEKILGKGMTSLRTRQRLVERLTDQGISDVRVLEAMRDTPRHLFLDEALASRAYEDLALPIGHQQTISQPYIVAKMTELLIQNERLSQRPLGTVLEIGTGCGYQTAILSKFSEKVISIERIKPLHEKAKYVLKDLKIRNAELFHDDGSKLENMTKKYDAILSAAALLAIPEYLYKSLEIGGRLISPIGNGSTQKLTLVTRVTVEEFKTEELEDVLFVPFLGGLID
jgi:protein-L-isoaspartate(D-aspartate) O-methyltransferase